LTNFFAFVSVLAVDRHPNLASSSFPFFLLQISWTTQMHMILKSLYTCFKLSKMSLQLSYGLSKTYDNSLFHEFFCLSSEHSCNTFTKHQYSYRTQLDDTTDWQSTYRKIVKHIQLQIPRQFCHLLRKQ
jgi:hypothetical protein